MRLLALLDFLAHKLTVASRARFLAAVVAWATSVAARTFYEIWDKLRTRHGGI
jgi:hypothetical protein